MNRNRLISSKQIIAEMYSDYNISNDDWVNKAQRHMARALALMHLDGYYELAWKFEDVVEFRAPLPCDERYTVVVLSNVGGTITRLPLTRDLALGADFSKIQTHKTYRGAINNNNLRTNFEDGIVMFLYYRNPVDDEGNLLIPNNDEVMEALPYFIIYKMSLSGYKHPVISIDRAEAKWKELYPRARNIVNFPSIEEMHRLTQVTNNPLVLNLIDEEWNIVADRTLEDLNNNILGSGGF